MATEAQVEANRANAQKSTGPRTPEGKAAVAQNAVKHGLRARTAVLLGEDDQEYAGFRTGMLEELGPEGVQEMEAATRIVDLSWQLRRAGRYQNAVLEALYDKYAAEQKEAGADPDPDTSVPSASVLGRMLLADFLGERVLERAQQYERRIESSLSRAKADLRQLRGQPRLGGPRGAGAGRWDDAGGFGRVSPAAGAGFTLETANSVLSAKEPLCQTKPMEGVSSVKCQVSSEDGQMMGPSGLQTSHGTLQTAAESRSCQTNPVFEGAPRLGRPGSSAERPGRAWDLLDQACERQPLLTGIRHPFAVVGAGERRRTGK